MSTSNEPHPEPQAIKCVVWDLDNTLWQGILLEDSQVTLQPNVIEVIEELDRRGILHSIASRNEYDVTIQKLQECGIADYFLYPQINWNNKSSSLQAIAQLLNIGLDSLVLIDDQTFEREEVAFELPMVECFDVVDLDQLIKQPRFNPRFITSESQQRRHMYRSDIVRKQVEEAFEGPSHEFLSSLNLEFSIKHAEESDLQRAEELTIRTHQLNTTGYTYSYQEFASFLHSNQHTLLIVKLDDKYGTYGTIGLTLIERQPDFWVIKLLLMSCRVVSRGVGTVILNHIISQAHQANVKLKAEFIHNGRNRMMYVTYKFAGFKEAQQHDDLILLEHDGITLQSMPAYVRLFVDAQI